MMIILLSLITVGSCVALQWRECVDNPVTKAITVNQLDAPPQIDFPGQFNFNLSFAFNRIITSVLADIDVTRYMFGIPISLPCWTHTTSTCTNLDICSFLEQGVNVIMEYQDFFGYQFQNIMRSAVNHTLLCLLQQEIIAVQDGTVVLPEISAFFKFLAKGDYTLTMRGREFPNGPIIGCLTANMTIA